MTKAFLIVTLIAVFGVVFARPVRAAAEVSIDPPAQPVALRSAELRLTLGLDRTAVTAPSTVLLTVIVTNTGTTIARNLSIDNSLPIEFAYLDSTLANSLQHLGELAPGDTIQKSVKINIPSSVATDRYVDEVIASADNADSVQSDIAIDVSNGRVLGASTAEPQLAASGRVPTAVFALGALLIGLGALRLRQES